jgi:hypothetical protein
MSINPLNVANVAGFSLAQAKGSDVERAHKDVGAQRRQMHHERKAESAAGIGEPDGEDLEIADRNGDGRRPWEEPPPPELVDDSPDTPQGRAPSHETGNLLDLSG